MSFTRRDWEAISETLKEARPPKISNAMRVFLHHGPLSDEGAFLCLL